jgi:hypothetical protein
MSSPLSSRLEPVRPPDEPAITRPRAPSPTIEPRHRRRLTDSQSLPCLRSSCQQPDNTWRASRQADQGSVHSMRSPSPSFTMDSALAQQGASSPRGSPVPSSRVSHYGVRRSRQVSLDLRLPDECAGEAIGALLQHPARPFERTVSTLSALLSLEQFFDVCKDAPPPYRTYASNNRCRD